MIAVSFEDYAEKAIPVADLLNMTGCRDRDQVYT
jgi:hypothetical protein